MASALMLVKRLLVLLLGVLVMMTLVIFLDDTLYWERFGGVVKAKVFKQPRGNWYSPLATVPGGQGDALTHWSAEQLQIPEAALNKAQAYVTDRNSSSFLVWHNGAVARESYFDGHHHESLIVSKSMAKPLASMVVARAFEQGYFESLDQSAADFIDEWRGTDKQAITVRHLLNMSSGLQRFYRNTINPFSFFHRGFLSSEHEDLIVNQLPLHEPPGSYYDYSQPTSDLIAVLVERATGKSYEEYLSTQLLKPLGAAGGEIWLNRAGGVAHSGCCIMLPADTWLRLGVLMALDGVWQGERLLPDWWNREILKGSSANPNYGLYFFLGSPYVERRHVIDPQHFPNGGTWQSEPYAADDLFMFDGNGNQVLYIVPSRRLVILRTGGSPGRDADGGEWDNTYLPNTIIRALDENRHSGEKNDNKGSVAAASRERKTPKKSPPFSAAMQTYKPLGRVPGDVRPLVNNASGINKDDVPKELAAALDYAEAMDSYALLVWHGGELLVEKYFHEFDENLRSDTASMHKSVLALLIAAAIDDGFIESVDDPVGNYLPQWRDQPEGDITVAQLLTMSSGLRPLSMEGGADSPRIRFFSDGENARKTLLAMQLEVTPGSRFLYANTNSQLLGMVLEAATEQPYAEYLSQRLWQRLRAADAFVWHYEPGGFPRTYSALLARPKDWLRVGLLIKDQGRFQGDQIIPATSIAAITEPSPVNSNYGWQIWLGRKYEAKRFYNDKKTGVGFSSSEPYAVSDMIYFDGIGGQRVYISRKEDLVIVRVGDRRFDWDDTRLPNLVLRALHK